jgi:site-specific recombinase XerD
MTRQRGGSYVADGVDRLGKRRRVHFRSLERAKDYEDQILSHGYQYTVGHLFPKWADELWSGTKNQVDALNRTKLVIQALGKDTPIAKVDRASIKKLSADWLAHGNTQATVNRKLSILSKLMKHAVDEEVIEEAPKIVLKHDPDSRRFRVLSESEEDRLLAAFEREDTRRFVEFLLDTGCRYSEPIRLEWDDIDHTRRRIMIWKSKTGRPRPIPLTDRAYAALMWTKAQGWERPWSRIVYRSFMTRWHVARVKAGLGPDVIPYVCRHTCCTRLVLGGLDPFRLKNWMGHADISTTDRYFQMNADDLQQGAAILSRGKLREVR